jgi:hypothetical protein
MTIPNSGILWTPGRDTSTQDLIDIINILQRTGVDPYSRGGIWQLTEFLQRGVQLADIANYYNAGTWPPGDNGVTYTPPDPSTGSSRRRAYTDQQMIDIVTAKVQSAMASQLGTVSTGQPMDPSPTLDPATVAGIKLAVTQIATITTGWRLQVFRANPPLMDGSKVRRPATTAERDALTRLLGRW